MALLIDGYNLLHVTGLFGRGAPTFEASRQALLGFLSAALDDSERAHTTIVFDAAHAPPGLPDEYSVDGICVRFVRHYESADALLEELIAAHGTARKLVVVSSDHRVQRAAKKRRATAVDSDVWYRATAERLKNRHNSASELPDVKPDVPLTKGEVAAWLRLFGAIDIAEVDDPFEAPAAPVAKTTAPRKKSVRPTAKKRSTTRADQREPTSLNKPRAKKPVVRRVSKKPKKPRDLGFGDIQNPFPPGYGEDVGP